MAFDIDGNVVTDDSSHYCGGEGTLYYSPLALNQASALEVNDLGGNGPGMIRVRDVTSTRTASDVAMEIFNTTEYRPANRNVNGFLRGGILQINLAPFFDTSGVQQPFAHLNTQTAGFSLGAPGLSLNSSVTNMVALWYRFVDMVTGADVELEEFSISLFDFDQDFADGDKAYVRETVIVAEWTTAFVTNTSQLERHFAQVPVRTVTSVDPITGTPNEWGLVMKSGVALRSTEQGTGPAFAVKYEWEACQGACLRVQACNMSQLLSASSHRSSIYWSGCGFTNRGFAAPVVPGSSYLNGNGYPVACTLDCPRTWSSYDDGNPTDPFALTQQQRDRAVTLLFRRRSNFTLFYRTDIGSAALSNRNGAEAHGMAWADGGWIVLSCNSAALVGA